MAFAGSSRIVGGASCIFGLIVFAPQLAFACATVTEDLPTLPTENFVTSERAVIIWDQAHKTEHFIRQATIQTDHPDIGFLVPTPEKPELAEADERIFDMAAFLGQPKTISPTNYCSPWTLISPLVTSSLLRLDRLTPAALLSGFHELKAVPRKPNILGEQDVAGYHATTLSLADDQMLSAWLVANNYLSTPELKAWLKPYAAAGWKITAFRLIKRDETSDSVTTRAIRLSFLTNRPFYPYSEPSDRQKPSAASPQGRALRVTILSNERMTGELKDQKPWPEKLEFAGPSVPPSSAKSAETMKQWFAYANLDAARWRISLPTKLTTFIDESNPRPGTADLYFTPDRNQGSFQGEAVDFTLPPQTRIVFSYSFLDVAALLLMFILPSVPLYCGWKVLNQSPEIKPHRLLKISSPKPKIRLTDRLVGALAIALGIFYGSQFVLLLLGEIASAYFGWTDLSGHWIWMFLGLSLAVVIIIAMSWGVVYCGVNIGRVRLAKVDEWQGLWGCLSCTAGFAAFLAVTSILFSLVKS